MKNISTEENELIHRCIDNDRDSQQKIYEKYAPKMLGVSYRYCRTVSDAEDVMQDSFIKAFSQIFQFKFEGSFENWLRKVVVNTAINFLMTNKKFRDTLEVYEYEALITETVENESRLNTADIIETIKALPDGYRTVLNLYSIEGYSHKEIGEMLNITESTSRSQYARARMLLARILTAKGRISGVEENLFLIKK